VAALRERQALVSSISSGLTPLEGAGLVTVVAQLDPQNLERAEAGVIAQIERVRDRGVTDDELRRAITAAEVDHEFSTETAEGRARAYGQAETVWRLEEELIYLDRLRSVSVAQIKSVARRYLDPGRYVRVTVLPSRS
jgi:predicted Zn-dependent peptidase